MLDYIYQMLEITLCAGVAEQPTYDLAYLVV